MAFSNFKSNVNVVKRVWTRAERLAMFAGLPAAVVMVGVLTASAWWTLRTSQHDQQRARAEQVSVLASMIGHNAELMLASGEPAELSPLRSIVADAAANYHLSTCRLTLGNGLVIADADPKLIGEARLPAKWPRLPGGGTAGAGAESADASPLHRRQVIDIPGRGQAALEITAADDSSPWANFEVQAGVGVIGVAGMAGLLLAYRALRSQLRGLASIRDALSAAARGDDTAAALKVDETMGKEAAAWNAILADREALRRGVAAKKAGELLAARPEQNGDLASACDAFWQGLLLIDETLKVKYANGAAGVFLGVKREEMTGKDVLSFISDEKARAAIRDVATGHARSRMVVEVRTGTENGAPARLKIDDGADRRGKGAAGVVGGAGVLRVSIRPVRREDSASAMIVIEDVTQQRVADEARNHFVAQATHELRTPLTNIRLYVDQLLDEEDADAATRQKAINVISQEARRLERIIGDMLSVSEIEAGSLKLHTGDIRLAPLFEELKADYEAQAQSKDIKLFFDAPPKLPVIQGDRDKFGLALHNLIGNALKYTPTGGQVTVKVEIEESSVTVKVVDNGIGIRPEEVERIFEKFYRANDKRISNITGTGLGLTLAREVARLHGGDVTVQSQVDKGSTFTLMVPTGKKMAA